jgi:sialic acid synthase SpsE
MKILDLFNNVSPDLVDRPYIIAEIGVNYEGSMDLARRLIYEAKEGGADAAKFQTYRADTIAAKESPAYWDLSEEPTTSQHQLFKKHEGFWLEEMVSLREYCHSLDIEFLSTPFDFEAADFLNDLMDVYKISSSDITNRPFIEHIANFGKPIILSTGASSLPEIEEAVSWIASCNNSQIALLHCILNYPTDDANANLGMIVGLKQKFPEYLIGYSDHTTPKDMKVCEIAALLGSRIIEKHFTHDKTLAGNDHYHAMDKNDLMAFRCALDRNREIFGTSRVLSLESESVSRDNARRSLVAARDMRRGHKITFEDLTFKRPGSGVSPKFIYDIIGREMTEDVAKDAIMQWHYFK